ncbi:putative ribonuclease H-like domain-containing protein [Tanacetum coccineum]|uniref:Ribonuclease H-like domain-containing protein n=1 Tax=Tanacetum coccineum TaxID=301880 RepID=A0ABQ5GVJ4_9ASTR
MQAISKALQEQHSNILVMQCIAVNTVAPKSKVNDALPTTYSYFKAHSPVRRAFNQKSAAKNKLFNEKVNTTRVNNVTTARPKEVVSAAVRNRENAVKSSSCWIWRPTGNGNPQYTLQDQGIFDSGCSRHMTRNKSFLTDYQEIDGGFVAFARCVKGVTTMDLFGPVSMKSINKKSYCPVVTDDFSRFSWVFFLATKDETPKILKNFITGIENQTNHKVKSIRCDNGTEFKNRIMNELCEMKGIRREFSVARTPQQNGVAERKYKTLIEATRTMLADSKLPTTFWAEVVNTACYVQNRVLVIKPDNKTPYELFLGTGPNWMFDIDTLTMSMNYQPVFAGNQTNGNAGITKNIFPKSSKDEVANDARKKNGVLDPAKEDDKKSVKEDTADLLNTGIFSGAYDDEDVGAEADLNNLEKHLELSTYSNKPGFTRIHPKDANHKGPLLAPKLARMNKSALEHAQEPRMVTQALTDPSWIEAMQDELLQFRLQKFDAQEVLDEFYKGAHFLLRVAMNTASTPIENNKALLKHKEAEDVDVHLYRSMIGSLMYLTASRPDIMFTVCAYARFQVTPKVSHLHAMKRIFRYLKGQPKLGLWYPRDSPFDLESFSDSDYAGASLDRKSTTGGVNSWGKRLISWQCQKQTIVANSTTEAEYVVAANCCGQKTVKTRQARRREKIVVSDDEEDLEDSSKQGRMIEEIDQDAGVHFVSTGSGGVSTASRLFSTTEESVSTASASMPVSTAEEWENIRARVKADEELIKKTTSRGKKQLKQKREKAMTQAKTENYTDELHKPMEVKELFETTNGVCQLFCTTETEDRGRASELAAGSSQATITDCAEVRRSKRGVEVGLDHEGSKKQKTNEASELVKYPIIDWEVYSEDTRRDDLVKLWDLVKERFSTTKPTDDKEKELWVELKRLFELDSDDTL